VYFKPTALKCNAGTWTHAKRKENKIQAVTTKIFRSMKIKTQRVIKNGVLGI
jgi:hypothetical protein